MVFHHYSSMQHMHFSLSGCDVLKLEHVQAFPPSPEYNMVYVLKSVYMRFCGWSMIQVQQRGNSG
jgi:hypothetical protein